MLQMITVVERRDIVTRFCVKESGALEVYSALRKLMKEKGWLAVSLSTVSEHPRRFEAEVNRALAIIDLIASAP